MTEQPTHPADLAMPVSAQRLVYVALLDGWESTHFISVHQSEQGAKDACVAYARATADLRAEESLDWGDWYAEPDPLAKAVSERVKYRGWSSTYTDSGREVAGTGYLVSIEVLKP